MDDKERGRMSTPITAELREHAYDHIRLDLLPIADRIDAEHRRRMEDCRRNTRREVIRYMRGVLTDLDRGVRRVRKGDKAEVVRCADCRWAHEVEPVDGWKRVCRVRPIMPHYVRGDGYCDQGERREVDE